jgi:dihydropyrimidinase
VAEGKTGAIYHALSRPPRIEAEATARAIALAETVDAPIYIVHVSCAESLEEVVRGKRRGVDVAAETCPQYLYTTMADLERPDNEGLKFIFTPPPRTAEAQDALWNALTYRQLDAVSSDHCSWPFSPNKLAGKDDFRQVPNGAPGVEERLMLTYQGVNEGRLSINQFVELVSTRPAQRFGLFPNKGAIAVGADADVLVWDPNASMTISKSLMHTRTDYSTYEGKSVTGLPRTVLLAGKVIVEGRQYVSPAPSGRFIKRDKYRSSRQRSNQ